MEAAPTVQDQVYANSFEIIFLLFVLAIVLELALAVLFRWRPFVEILNPRGVRPLIAVVVAFLFVKLFELDLVTSLVNAATDKTYPASLPGEILTAFVIAGGSAGVNSLLVAMGYREIKTPETAAPKPPPDKAWIAVKARRERAVGVIEVLFGPAVAGPAAAAPGAPAAVPPALPIVGTIEGRSRSNLLSYFVADRGRFPNYGGHTLDPGNNTEFVLVLVGADAENNVVTATWGPRPVARGAIIDLELTV